MMSSNVLVCPTKGPQLYIQFKAKQKLQTFTNEKLKKNNSLHLTVVINIL